MCPLQFVGSWPLQVCWCICLNNSAKVDVPLAVCWLMAPASLLVHLLKQIQQVKVNVPLAVCWLMAPASLSVHLLNTYQQHKIGCHS